MDVNSNSDIAKELAKRLADAEAAKDKLEAVNSTLREEIERKNKSLEGFIAEIEALKAELGGNHSPLPDEKATDRKTRGGTDLIVRARRLGW